MIGGWEEEEEEARAWEAREGAKGEEGGGREWRTERAREIVLRSERRDCRVVEFVREGRWGREVEGKV